MRKLESQLFPWWVLEHCHNSGTMITQDLREPADFCLNFSSDTERKEESFARSYWQPLLYSSYKLFNSFSDELASPPGGCLSVSEEKGPENWACPSNQHKQSLKPLFQNPSWKGNEFGKETGVTGAHRMLHAGYRANRILNSTERPRATDDKIWNAQEINDTSILWQ